MENIEVRVDFGVGNTISRTFPRGTTIGQAINDTAVKAALNHPANVRALLNRVPQDLGTALQHGDRIVLETIGTAKAS